MQRGPICPLSCCPQWRHLAKQNHSQDTDIDTVRTQNFHLHVDPHAALGTMPTSLPCTTPPKTLFRELPVPILQGRPAGHKFSLLSFTSECLDVPFIPEGYFHWVQESVLAFPRELPTILLPKSLASLPLFSTFQCHLMFVFYLKPRAFSCPWQKE